ncbi:MAG: PEP-CTERM sorting domain-containing protein [Armatimonadota bacterium]
MKKPALILLVGLGLASISGAQVITQTQSFGFAPTNWTNSLTFNKFNPALGNLTSIVVSLTGQLNGEIKFEWLETGSGASVTGNLAGQVKIQKPDLSNLVVTSPLATTSDTVSAYDGTTDFGGTSGKTYSALSATDTQMNTLTGPADFALFSGAGTIALPIAGSSFSGVTTSPAGNITSNADVLAKASATITYNYTPVPEPASMIALGLGLTGLAARRKRK